MATVPAFMALLDLGGVLWGFLPTELGTIMVPARSSGPALPGSPKAASLWEVFSALAASLQCVSALMVLVKTRNHLAAFVFCSSKMAESGRLSQAPSPFSKGLGYRISLHGDFGLKQCGI